MFHTSEITKKIVPQMKQIDNKSMMIVFYMGQLMTIESMKVEGANDIVLSRDDLLVNMDSGSTLLVFLKKAFGLMKEKVWCVLPVEVLIMLLDGEECLSTYFTDVVPFLFMYLDVDKVVGTVFPFLFRIYRFVCFVRSDV
eukprot:TRINITY_DN1458_c0_g1_i2.p2 TRINITY_DN1458_c0_g1~~TRINITY_DN1458_c0_g1_i2.p2  ORF type:complete len:140 (+),score=30.64 TRINITY_DN1458_c0_g1_i2:39-458(+)